MNSLDQLICQLNILLEIVDELLKSIEKAQKKKDLLKTEFDFLNETIKKKEFLTNQIDID